MLCIDFSIDLPVTGVSNKALIHSVLISYFIFFHFCKIFPISVIIVSHEKSHVIELYL